MKHKNDLFRLIHSMSKSEKRYFTLDAQKAGKKNARYLALFRLIGKMDAYDDTKLKRDYKYLAVDKSYLYEAILRSMRDYHSQKSRAAQIKEKLLDAKYLYERELYDLCDERLKEAKKMAKELKDDISLLEINKQKRGLERTIKKNLKKEILRDLAVEQSTYLTSIEEEFDMLNLYDKIFSNAMLNKKQLVDDEQFIKGKKFSSALAACRFYQSAGVHFKMKDDFDNAIFYYDKVMNWWDENSYRKEEDFYNYIIDVSNYLAACFRQEKFDDFESLIDRLENEQPLNTHHQKILFQRLFQFKLVYLINFGIVQDVTQVANQVEEGLGRFSLNPSTEKVLLMNTSILLFIAEHFEACIVWCSRLLKNKNKSTRPEINRGIQFLKCIAYYELEEVDAFENTLRSAARYFNKEQDQYLDYYLAFLNKIKKLMDVPSYEVTQQLQAIKLYIDQMRHEIQGRIPLGGIDEMTIWWIDSRLNKIPVAAAVSATKR